MANRFFETAAHAAAYAKFRPLPPTSLISQIVSFLKDGYSGNLMAAADVGCGSGQSTQVLAPYFEEITGLDISDAQIAEAKKKITEKNIVFKVSGAEVLPFSANSLQLVTASQACHWFDLPKFYKEVDRILVPGGVLALYGYLFPRPFHGDLSEKLYEVIDHVYSNILGPYWGERIAMVDASYGDLKIPYINSVYAKETGGYWGSGRKDVDNAYSNEKFIIPYPEFIRDDTCYVDKTTTVADITGYLTSWSGFQNFRTKNGDEAAQKILEDFQNKFMNILDVSTTPEDTEVIMRFPYFLLMGRKPLS